MHRAEHRSARCDFVRSSCSAGFVRMRPRFVLCPLVVSSAGELLCTISCWAMLVDDVRTRR